MRFATPFAFLLAVPLVLYLFLLIRNKRHQQGVRFSSLSVFSDAPRTLRERAAFLPLILRITALLCMIFALARPQYGKEEIRHISNGIAIEMVLDRSGSMGAKMEGTSSDRLTAVKKVFLDFVTGNGGSLKGRPDDLIGVISFARYADTICPLTLTHATLTDVISNLHLVDRREEDGTAIGDALALAAARLEQAEKSIKDSDKTGYKIKSKIIILLTDGQNNAGKRSPMESAKLAEKWGIKVYTIGIGAGENFMSMNTMFGKWKVPIGSPVDSELLQNIASSTGGKYWPAQNEKTLEQIYHEIDQLEKSEVESVIFTSYKEAFLPFVLAALFLLVFEIMLANTVLRKVP